jgi:hypothetical protein
VMRHALICVLAASLAAPAFAEESVQRMPAESSVLGRASQTFWDGVKALSLTFTRLGSLSGGADQGEIWASDIRTGQRSQIGTAGDLSWPVIAPDGTTVYALRGNQLVRLDVSGTGTTAVVGEPGWRKLL